MKQHDIVIWDNEYWMYVEDHRNRKELVLLRRANGHQEWVHRDQMQPVVPITK